MFTSHYKYRRIPEIGDIVHNAKNIVLQHGIFYKGSKFILMDDKVTKCVLKHLDTGYIIKPDDTWIVNIYIDDFVVLSNPFDSEKLYNKDIFNKKVDGIIQYSCPNLIKLKSGCKLCKLKINQPIQSDCVPEEICISYLSEDDQLKLNNFKNK